MDNSINLGFMFLFLVASNAYDTNEEFALHIFFHVYKTYSSYDRIPYQDGPQRLEQHKQLNPSWQTLFYFPGWGEDPTDPSLESVTTVTNALVTKGYINIIVIDYCKLIRSEQMVQYVSAVANATTIGRLLGRYLKEYVRDVSQVRLVGHSMGAQIMSYAAKEFGSGRLRLTGLDPAHPIFNIAGVPHLEASDGSFVDVIHTDSSRYGEDHSIGTVDFFPNNGIRTQPYCALSTTADHANDFCSHRMSWRYFAESINNERSFAARKCSQRTPCVFLNDRMFLCNCVSYGNEVAYMGYEVSHNSFGNFYLLTNDKRPFGMGINGLPSDPRFGNNHLVSDIKDILQNLN